MTSFKQKPEKIKYLTNINTLDEIHRKQVENFESKKKNLPKKRTQLTAHESELLNLHSKDRISVTQSDIKRISFLKEKIDELREEIKEIENDSNEIDYYSRTHEVLLEYYNQIDDTNEDEEMKPDNISEDIISSEINMMSASETNVEKTKEDENRDKVKDKLKLLNELSQQKRKVKKETKKRFKKMNNIVKKKSILSFFTEKKTSSSLLKSIDEEDRENISASETQTENISEIKKTSEDSNEDISSNTSSEGIIEQIVSNRASLYETYMGLINKTTTLSALSMNKSRMIRICGNCSTEKTLIQSEGIYVCKKCGEVEHIIIESEVPNHKDTVNEKPRYPYKRVNHLLELIQLLEIIILIN
jgi:hypothetical protein